jgi:hypothetical protein
MTDDGSTNAGVREAISALLELQSTRLSAYSRFEE